MDVSWILKYTHKWRSFLNIDVPWPPDYTYTKHFSYYMSVMPSYYYTHLVYFAQNMGETPQKTPFPRSRKK
jgi:hypothetical protein